MQAIGDKQEKHTAGSQSVQNESQVMQELITHVGGFRLYLEGP